MSWRPYVDGRGELTDQVTLSVGLDYRGFGHACRRLACEKLTTIRGGGWLSRAELDDVQGEILRAANCFHSARTELLVWARCCRSAPTEADEVTLFEIPPVRPRVSSADGCLDVGPDGRGWGWFAP